MEPNGEFLEEPQRILNQIKITLWRRAITQVKVQWKHFSLEEATWEDESFLQEAYPELFTGMA